MLLRRLAGESDCQDLEQNTQCTWLRDTCLDESQNGPCKVTERTFQCPVPGEPRREQGVRLFRRSLLHQRLPPDDRAGKHRTISRMPWLPWARSTRPEKEFDPDKLGCSRARARRATSLCLAWSIAVLKKVSGLLSGGAAYAASLANAPVLLTAVATQFLTVFLCSKEEKMLDVKDRLSCATLSGATARPVSLASARPRRRPIAALNRS